MSKEYSLKEIVRFAIEIEKEGAIFYEEMSKKTAVKEIKELFLSLKSDEIVHKEKFEDLMEKLGPDENEYVFHLENEYIAYLHNLIENTIFPKTDIEKLAKELKDDKAVIEYAITREDDSINYYENLKKIINKKYNSTLNAIINEEITHKEKLEKVKKILK